MAETKHTFILVPGSWIGGWYWHDVADILRTNGHSVYAPSLTGLGERSHLINARVNLTTHIMDIVNLIKWEQLENIVLCGHSYGGMVISGVTEYVPKGIIHSLVYLDALYPASGKCLLNYFPLSPKADSSALTIPPLPASLFGCKGTRANWFDKLTTPHPLAAWKEKLIFSTKRDDVKSKWFIVAKKSRMPVFAEMAQSLKSISGWNIKELNCGHLTAVEMPLETAEILLNAVPV